MVPLPGLALCWCPYTDGVWRRVRSATSISRLLILGIKRSSQVLTAVSAGVAIVFAGLDKLGLMVAVFAGLLVTLIVEWRSRRDLVVGSDRHGYRQLPDARLVHFVAAA